MVGMPCFRGLSPDLVFDPFYVNITYENSTAEHDRNASLVRGDPHRGLVQSFRVTLLHNVFDPRNDLEGIDAAGRDLDFLSAFDFQIQQVTILSAENIEVKVITNFEILTTSEVDRCDRVDGIGGLIEFVFLYLASFVTMNRPFLRVSIELCFSVNDLLVFPLTKGKSSRRKRFRLD